MEGRSRDSRVAKFTCSHDLGKIPQLGYCPLLFPHLRSPAHVNKIFRGEATGSPTSTMLDRPRVGSHSLTRCVTLSTGAGIFSFYRRLTFIHRIQLSNVQCNETAWPTRDPPTR